MWDGYGPVSVGSVHNMRAPSASDSAKREFCDWKKSGGEDWMAENGAEECGEDWAAKIERGEERGEERSEERGEKRGEERGEECGEKCGEERSGLTFCHGRRIRRRMKWRIYGDFGREKPGWNLHLQSPPQSSPAPRASEVSNLHRHHEHPMHPIFTGTARPIFTGATGPPNIQFSPVPRACTLGSSASIIYYRACGPLVMVWGLWGKNWTWTDVATSVWLATYWGQWSGLGIEETSPEALQCDFQWLQCFEISGICLIITLNLGSLLFVIWAIWQFGGTQVQKSDAALLLGDSLSKMVGNFGIWHRQPILRMGFQKLRGNTMTSHQQQNLTIYDRGLVLEETSYPNKLDLTPAFIFARATFLHTNPLQQGGRELLRENPGDLSKTFVTVGIGRALGKRVSVSSRISRRLIFLATLVLLLELILALSGDGAYLVGMSQKLLVQRHSERWALLPFFTHGLNSDA